jgi:hypothetical protein
MAARRTRSVLTVVLLMMFMKGPLSMPTVTTSVTAVMLALRRSPVIMDVSPK